MKVLDIQPQCQTFKVKMEGVNRRIRLLFNTRAQTWTMDIYNEDGSPFVMGVALKLQANALSKLKLKIGDIITYDTSLTSTEADFYNLSDTVLIAQLEESELV
jgi:23S rRNA C2498 (ribose-2'-O)-methylase RlmM